MTPPMQMVDRLRAVFGVMGGHDGSSGIHQTSSLGGSTALHRGVLRLDRDDTVLCHRGKLFEDPHPTPCPLSPSHGL